MRNWPAILMMLGGALLLFGDSLPDFGGILPSPAVEGELTLVIVEESSERPENVAKIIRNQRWRDELGNKDVEFLAVDKDLPKAIDGGYTAAARQVGIPAALLIDKAKKLLIAELITGGTEQLDKMLAEVGR